MRIGRVRVGGRASTAVLRGRTVHLVRGGPLGRLEPTGETFPLSKVTLLAPIQPGKVVAIGLNYRSHLEARVVPHDEPTHPEPFLKTPSSVIGPGQAIVLPADAGRVDEEGEVVVVIGKRARNLRESEVDAHVLGYTAGNDVSAREWQRADLQWWRAKSSDTFTAVGPWIATDLDPERIPLTVRLNGEVVQQADTSQLIHSIRKCVAFVTSAMTLEPGDLVYTGTPGTTAELHAGDTVQVEVGGVGVLTNPVAAAP
ncbi:MAG: fumarylacetoacetate hydrolase family protein [Dehalococcoidia bacterium]|nr:fumarylacetoacetate hydrolase family protein [Dehalococcoidia bacterium]